MSDFQIDLRDDDLLDDEDQIDMSFLDKKNKKDEDEAEKAQRVGFFALFRYAKPLDVFLMIFGTIGGIGRGLILPGFSLIFGDIIDVLANINGRIEEDLVPVALRFLYFAGAAFFVCWIQTTCWMLTGQRQADRIRRLYVRSVLRQEISWFDKENANEVYSRLSGDLVVISDGLGEKCGQAIQFFAQFVGGFALGFVEGWELTLVILAISPLLVISAAIMMFLMASMTTAGQKAYAKAGALALEVITSIRTVAAFGGEERETKRYAAEIRLAKKSGIKKSFVTGLGFGFVMLCVYGAYGLALWYGSLKIADNPDPTLATGYSGGTVMTVLFSVLIGAFSLGQMSPSIAAISSAQGAAYIVYDTIERESNCDPFSPPADLDQKELLERKRVLQKSIGESDSITSVPEGRRLSTLRGKITLKDIHFAYPTRPNVKVLNGLNLKIRPGQTVALVGPSGCGKSTVLGLLERFYQPASGSIAIDDTPLDDLNIHWWRSQIGFVGQQPVLFSGTISENIALGARMSFEEAVEFNKAHLPATRQEIEAAAKAANAHDFIMEFPNGYDTVVGAKGAQLSGGQKQRIAIARAVVNNPLILLLDEATSALDSKSESVVQEALDNAMADRTTLVIAHRLATVRDADVIVVFEDGVIVEKGDFTSLANDRSSRFHKMVRMQGLINESGMTKEKSKYIEDNEEEESETNSDAPPPLPVTSAPYDSEDDEEPKQKERPAEHDDSEAGTMKRLSLRLSKKLSLSKIDTEQVAKESKKAKKKATKKSAKKRKRAKQTAKELEKMDDAERLEKLAELQAEEDEEDDDVEEEQSPLSRVYKLNKPELPWYILGCFFAMANGVKDPLFALIFVELLTAFNQPQDQVVAEATKFSLYFLYIGIGTAIVTIGQSVIFGYCFERLTERVRNMTFTAILRQEIAFFDRKANEPSKLAARLSQDAALLSGMFGEPLGVTVQNIATAVLGLCIAFYFSWKMTLLVLATVPVLIFGQAMEFIAMKGFAASAQEDLARATAIASEAIGDIRTVSSLGNELTITSMYERTLQKPSKVAVVRAWVIGVLTGLSQALMFASYTLNFWFGGTLIIEGSLTFQAMLNVFMAILFSAMGVGQASAMMPDASKARAAAVSIFKLLDRESKCDPFATKGTPPLGEGRIEMKDVEFAYPTRRQKTVLRGLSVSVDKGEVLAFVGESGCGKSTSIGLIQRFYEAQQGSILIDGDEVTDLDIRRWRRCIGLVMQEPSLFTGTIRENIAYGIPDDERDVITNADIEEAAKKANAYGFIQKLPNGFDTDLGENGAQLSGGQKQRIAIARAIVRNPSVLLLDEATSALDEKSQHLVQEALETAMKGRTTITIAHRLSTIKDADKIAVIQKGRVVEIGRHKQLMKKKGFYYKLVRRQTAEN